MLKADFLAKCLIKVNVIPIVVISNRKPEDMSLATFILPINKVFAIVL